MIASSLVKIRIWAPPRDMRHVDREGRAKQCASSSERRLQPASTQCRAAQLPVIHRESPTTRVTSQRITTGKINLYLGVKEYFSRQVDDLCKATATSLRVLAI
ncbi:unnamed protein product [Trichogramma brassicae]|uniref:Uncharacterized protein n=1 Tax=Trichogramma brassicae TaxID=86971 RepID=A0A6H5J528_9HYME|nr:unnamed protein product [Trichogramma brassicae]